MNMMKTKKLKKITDMQNFSSLVILLIMLIITALLQGNFFTLGSFVSNVNAFAPLILLTIGQTAVMIAGSIDLSNGAMLSLMTCIMASTMQADDPGSGVRALLLAFAAAVICGLLNGFAVGFMKEPPVIVTFATSYIFLGAGLFILPRPGGNCANWVLGFYNMSLVENAPAWLVRFTSYFPPVFLIVVVIIIIALILKKTRFTRYLYATGSNEASAYATGINTAKIRIIAYLIDAFCVFLTAIYFVAQNRSGDYQLGDAYTLRTVAAAVIGGVSMAGGKGDVFSAVIGALIFSLVNKIIFFANLPTAYQTLVSGIIVIAALGVSFIYSYLDERKRIQELRDRAEVEV